MQEVTHFPVKYIIDLYFHLMSRDGVAYLKPFLHRTFNQKEVGMQNESNFFFSLLGI